MNGRISSWSYGLPGVCCPPKPLGPEAARRPYAKRHGLLHALRVIPHYKRHGLLHALRVIPHYF